MLWGSLVQELWEDGFSLDGSDSIGNGRCRIKRRGDKTYQGSIRDHLGFNARRCLQKMSRPAAGSSPFTGRACTDPIASRFADYGAQPFRRSTGHQQIYARTQIQHLRALLSMLIHLKYFTQIDPCR
jgi:hypothetical protein